MFTELKIAAGRRSMTDGEARISAAIGLVVTVFFLVAIFEDYTPQRLGIVFFILFWIPMLVLHEVGHAVAARMVGWRVREIVIGFGRELWQWQLGDTRVRIRLAPLEGYVLPVPAGTAGLRAKSAFIYAAGPGAEFLLLGLLIAVFGWDTVFNQSDAVSLIALKSLAFVIIVGAGFNLLPFGTDGGVSDGLGILSSPFLSDEAVENRLLTFDLRDIEERLDAGDTAGALHRVAELGNRYPGNLWLLLVHCDVLSVAGRSDEARQRIRDRLADASLAERDRREWLKCQALVELDAVEPDFLTLDLALQNAFRITPNAADLEAIRGASLVLRHRVEEGGNLLAETWRRNAPGTDDAMMLAWLTIAAHRQGDGAARTHFRESFDAVNRRASLRSRVDALAG